jgi:integrase
VSLSVFVGGPIVAKLVGLLKRSGIYHLRVMVPLDLRQAHHGRIKLVRSLGTSDRHQAALNGARLRADLLTHFDTLRNPSQASQERHPQANKASPLVSHCVAPVLPPTGHTLRDVFNQWRKTGDRSNDSIQACDRALKAFEASQGTTLAPGGITHDHGTAFRHSLLTSHLAQKTARDYFIWVRALLSFAQTDLGMIARNPWARLSIDKPKTTPRRPWTTGELQALFSLPLFTGYQLPQASRGGQDAAYWLPLLGLFTGARISELAQLSRGDVVFHQKGTGAGPQAVLNITDEGVSQRLKTAHSKRTVPVHPELVRLGFLAYAQSLGGPAEASLWPALPLRKGKPGGYFSQWFGVLRRGAGLGEYPDFHCFRHSVRTKLAEARFPESVKDRITGHGVKGSVGTQTYEHTDHLIWEAIQAIHYPGLKLPHVFERTSEHHAEHRCKSNRKGDLGGDMQM